MGGTVRAVGKGPGREGALLVWAEQGQAGAPGLRLGAGVGGAGAGAQLLW